MSGEDNSTNTVSSTVPAQSITIQKFIKMLEKFGAGDQRGLKKVYLSNRSITCNDGSQAGFYLRKSHGSKRWIMFLEGGWYCFDQRSCRSRWLKLRNLMTSTQWPDTRDSQYHLSSSLLFYKFSILLLSDFSPFFLSTDSFLTYLSLPAFSGRNTLGQSRREPSLVERQSRVSVLGLYLASC